MPDNVVGWFEVFCWVVAVSACLWAIIVDGRGSGPGVQDNDAI